MTTKKQKHEAMVEKRERRLAEIQASGLEALRKDHKHRDDQRRQAQKEKHDKEHSGKRREQVCILCQDEFKAKREQRQSNE